MAINKEYDDIQLDVKFTQASSRANIVSEENISVSFSKLANWFEALVPTGGSSGQFLGWNSDGTAKWVSNPNSDTKVKNTYGTANTYYPAGMTQSSTTTTTQVADTSFKFIGTTGTTSEIGKAQLVLGNNIASGTANNKQGSLVIYGSTAYAHTLIADSGIPTENRTLYLPDKTDTLAVVGDIPTLYAGSNSTGGSALTVYGTLTNPSGQASYAIPFHTDISSGDKSLLNNDGIVYTCKQGTASATGFSIIELGNGINEGTAGNKYGLIRLYSRQGGDKYVQLYPATKLTANRNIVFPNAAGTVALTTDIPAVNDASLTLKGDGTDVVVFTANSASDKSLNITAGSNVTITPTAAGSNGAGTIQIASSHPTITKSADTTSTASPAHGGTFTVVDSVTREANGHVTKINTKTVTLPADSNTDTKVTQSSSTTSDFRPLLLGKNNQTNPENLETTVTDQTYVTKHVFVQPSTGNLTLYNASGDSPSLIFRRGTFVDNLNDWKIYVSGGELRFAQSTANASSETWTTKMYFHASDGNLYVGSTKVSLNGHTHSQYLPKTTYEWNKEISFGNSGYLKIGSFPMYDTNITIDINATTSKTYHGTVVIATQNVSTTSMGSQHIIHVYDDPTGNIAASLRIVWTSGSRNYDIYFIPQSWSKNFIHIRALGNYMDGATDICVSQTGTAPATTSGLEPVNILSVTSTGNGNAVTKVEIDSVGNLAVTKESTFSLSTHKHDSLYGVQSSSAVPITTLADGQLKVFYNVNKDLTGNMPATNNANAIIQISKHHGNYDAQLGFSSNGSIYYRCCDNVVLSDSVPWRRILDSSNTSFTQTLSSGTKIGTIKINGTSTDLYCETNTNTDTKVTQTNTTTSADYRVLLSGNANDTTETTTGRKSANLKFNPSSGGLYSFGFLWTDITGSTLDINTLTLSNGTLHSRRFIEKTDGGAANITNIPVTGHPFLLEVDLIRWGSTTDYITRQRFTNAANGTYSYVRYCTSGTWGSWTTRKYTDTDTKVTSSANHYTPATASGQDKTASASGATAAWSIDVVKGVTLNTDGKGHVTGISVTSGKIPGNPNTDRYVNTASFADDSTNTAASPVKMTLTRAGSDTATVTANIPKVSSSSAGVAPKGAAVSTPSQSTKFLREDGSWAVPVYTSIPSGNVTGTGLTADKVILGNGNSTIKTSGKGITDNSSATAVTSTDTNLITARTLYYAGYLPLSGGTMTGKLTAKASQYSDEYDGALNMNNSNIYGVNSIYTADASDSAAEGIHFYRDSTHVDTLWMNGGSLLFVPNRELGTSTTAANSQKVARFTANPTTGQVVITDGTTGGVKSSGYTIATSVPSGAVFTDTKNTAGSTDTSSKIYLIGATSQAANPQTYSDNEVYTTSGVLTTKKVQVGGGSCTMEYNSTTQSLDFIFT